MKLLRFALLVALVACTSPARALEGIAGTLTSVGSDTASVLITRWAAAFQADHPGARIQAQASGSASAPIALIEGAADLGPMSRPMNASEEAAFRARYGYAPTRVVVAHDAIAVFVHPDNPLATATLADLDAIYSSTRACGATAPIRGWNDLRAGSGAPQPLLAIGRDSGSGTHELFRELALCGGRYRAEVVAWPGNGAVVATVAGNREAIGYAGFGFVNGLVRPLAIARSPSDPAIAPDERSIASGRYPLSRAIYVYLNRRPQQALADLPRAFLEYILSDDAQQLVRHEGFIPLDVDEAREQRALIR
ncbi:phosphate transport system substrate-binding protein [Dokdonella fugitiva]|uniref:Phosphate transport system substrate-binding protein n=1 Tax=Dokdonella fugitiva TaxID=328517 RepID=A0A839EU65_9GAMM|nr:PstS family phosphate ABC transporter substrate-binding protein [Dokdonella fugitiva]MBA8888047.1 phosphate transport system substrate-binding protein [Dokdonella fugitiva]